MDRIFLLSGSSFFLAREPLTMWLISGYPTYSYIFDDGYNSGLLCWLISGDSYKLCIAF